MKAWYAVYSKAQEEVWARNNLEERGIEAYLPRYRKRRFHARRLDFHPAPLFPRYLFVRADLAAGQRPRIVTAPGVSYLVSFGDRAPSLADSIIEEIQGREGPDGLVRLGSEEGFRRGEKVRVRDGAFCEKVGIFDSIADDRRVFILLDLMGRKVRVKLASDVLSGAT
ncbi:MAG: transcription termination/antitermination NusG family protein [Alphaproteobacteria bacterium]|jgi:transcriptional antiterminator RfaH|nr:transcriptional activator RfaH [Rhodospirillaceae bacterium]MDP6405276.1 transcription termination/antitermination NusG family protein [Alphaproteobacteria bacterium]MDP6623177.1 transcription termination/antitermination NusG family protein [Alphaproteobacteria bacterium]|tara:strand:+ start:1379 stop:1882 length:504 start_codon:yes stop_codon:yes gene_type:complete